VSGFRRTLVTLHFRELRYDLSAMSTLHPFRALRPNAASASHIAAVPYDVVSTDEAARLPMTTRWALRVSRAEIRLPAGTILTPIPVSPEGRRHNRAAAAR
jgi:hypothetical protein